MKKSILLAVFIAATSIGFAQSPKPLSIPAHKWNLKQSENISVAYRVTNDSILDLAFDKEHFGKTVVKIKTNNGVTVFRKTYKENHKMARFDVSGFPMGNYEVEFYNNGSLVSSYQFSKD